MRLITLCTTRATRRPYFRFQRVPAGPSSSSTPRSASDTRMRVGGRKVAALSRGAPVLDQPFDLLHRHRRLCVLGAPQATTPSTRSISSMARDTTAASAADICLRVDRPR